MNPHFSDNGYFAASDQGWFQWGTSWGRHESYATLEEFRAALGIDTGSRALHPNFIDPLANDFRLTPDAIAEWKANYPQGPVPGTDLGTRKD